MKKPQSELKHFKNHSKSNLKFTKNIGNINKRINKTAFFYETFDKKKGRRCRIV